MISFFQTCKADLGMAFSETIVFIFPDFINLFHLLPFSPSSHSSITLSIPVAHTFQMRMHLKPQARHSLSHSVTESQRWIFTNIPNTSPASGNISVVSQSYFRHISCIFRHISDISLPYLRPISAISLAYLKCFSDICQTYLRHIKNISQGYFGHISDISTPFLR